MLRWLGNPLSGERLRVELRPGSVGLVQRAVVPRSRMPLARALAVEAGAPGRENPTEPWRAAVDTLAAALRERRARLGRVEIVVSDHFVRYLLIPWSEGLVGDSERLSFARLAFSDRYGQLADTWDLCLDEQPAGRASFACAIDRALASSLREVVTRTGGHLAALRPVLADCVNRHRSALKSSQFCLAAAEPGRVSLAFHSRDGWQAVRSRRIDGPLSEALPTVVKQETVVGDATGGGLLYLCAGGQPSLAPFSVPGWRVVRLAESSAPVMPPTEPQLAAVEG